MDDAHPSEFLECAMEVGAVNRGQSHAEYPTAAQAGLPSAENSVTENKTGTANKKWLFPSEHCHDSGYRQL